MCSVIAAEARLISPDVARANAAAEIAKLVQPDPSLVLEWAAALDFSLRRFHRVPLSAARSGSGPWRRSSATTSARGSIIWTIEHE